MEQAPFFDDVADGPEAGAAWWLQTEDDVRIRMGAWRPRNAKGTVLIFPGRTEYVEKYGRTAVDFAKHGYATLAVDWRGQGLADRPLPDRATGHVVDFPEYQHDMRAVIAAAKALALPRPWHLIGHSMGGAIGLRGVLDGLDVETVVFSAPMWGIIIAPLMRPFARVVTGAARPIGLGHLYAPGTEAATYVMSAEFEGNKLTRDLDMFNYMQKQLRSHPELALGGPSLTWVHEALKEIRVLRAMPLPRVPCYCAVGSNERIADIGAIRDMMARWPGGVFEVHEGAEHEIMMERPGVRERFMNACIGLFETHEVPTHISAAAC